MPFLLHIPEYLIDLIPVEEELSPPLRVMVIYIAGLIRTYVTVEINLPAFYPRITIFQAYMLAAKQQSLTAEEAKVRFLANFDLFMVETEKPIDPVRE